MNNIQNHKKFLKVSMNKKILMLVSILSVLVLLLSACGGEATPTPVPTEQASAPNQVVAEGRLEPIHGTNLYFQARGVVEEVLVTQGDAVKAGDVLMRLENAGAAQAQVVAAQTAYDALLRNESGDRARLWKAYLEAQKARGEAEKKWDDLDVDAIEDDIEDRKATVEDRREDVQDAQDTLDKYKDLNADNASRKDAEKDLERAQEDLNRALRDLDQEIRRRDEVRAAYEAALGAEAEAKHQFEISQDGVNTDQLALAKVNLDAAQDALDNFVIRAPFDGVAAEINAKVGELASPEQRAVSVGDFSQWVVETTDVTELEVVKLSVGQAVRLAPDALPDLNLNGRVTEISQAYTQQGGDILYTVRIAVDGSDPRLKWGMTFEVTFE